MKELKQMDSLGIFLLTLVGTLWGLTNPFLEQSVNKNEKY